MNALRAALAAFAWISVSLSACSQEATSPTPSTDLAREIDSCSLLTAAEIRAVTGVESGAPERTNPRVNHCQWPGKADAIYPVASIGLTYGNARSWTEYRQWMIDNDYGDPEDGGEYVDIGLFGHYQPEADMIQVQAERSLLITLMVHDGSKAQIVDLAGKALARLD